MKLLIKPILLALTLGTASLSAGLFEGTLTYEVKSGNDVQEVSFLVKGNRMAIETPANPRGLVLLNRETMKAQVLMPQQKMYIEVPADKFVKNANQKETGQFEVTDETREILGYTAKKVIYTDGGETSELWITDELGSFQPLEGPLSGETPAELLNAFPNGGMPLVIKTSGKGRPTEIVVTSIKAENVADSDLEVPSGYRPLNLKGMALPGMP